MRVAVVFITIALAFLLRMKLAEAAPATGESHEIRCLIHVHVVQQVNHTELMAIIQAV